MAIVGFVCPKCGANYTLEDVRRKKGWFVCGKCETKLISYDPDDRDMHTIELSLLDDEGNIVESATFISSVDKIITYDTFTEIINKLRKTMSLTKLGD